MEVTKARYKANEGLKKRPRWRLILLVCCLVILLTTGGVYSYAALSNTPPLLTASITPPVQKQAEAVSMPWLNEGQAALGTLEDGVLTVSTLTEQPKPIASITKVITALAVLNKAPQDTSYTITPTDVSYYQSYVAKGGSVVPVKAGQVLNRTQVLQALLLASANNIADSLVGWHFKSMQEFTDYANKMIKSYGMTNTVVADASGFSPQTKSTPSDLIILAQKAMANPELASIFGLREVVIPSIGTIKNTNRLLLEPGVLGIKTGTTDKAGNCLLFAASHTLASGKKTTFIGAVLGAPNATAVFNNSKSLLSAAASNYQNIEVVPAGTVVGTYTSNWGQSTKLITVEALIAEAWKGKILTPELIMNFTGNSVSAEQVVGNISLGDKSIDVVSQQSIGLPSNIWRLANFW